MKILFEKDADYDVYKRDYYPLLVREGFSWRMFPELSIYLDKHYPGWQDGINTDKEHIRPDIPAIFVRMITLDEWVSGGALAEEYKRVVMDGKVSSLPHEIGHYIHLTKLGPDNSMLWLKASVLMGKSLNFDTKTTGNYVFKPSYEDFANEFESCIEGRKKNEPFMNFVRELFGIKYRIYTADDYRILKDKYGLDRAYVPIRLITDTFKDSILRDIEWLEATREVVVISAETGF